MKHVFRRRLIEVGLSEGHADELVALSRSAVRLGSRPLADGSLSPVPRSRLGGAPDLREGFAWPHWKGRALAFVAQVDLADVSGFSCCEPLPRAGLLSFFYDPEQEAWGFDPGDRGGWLVHFEPEPGRLRPAGALDSDPRAPFAPCSSSPVEVPTMPPPDSLAVAEIGLSGAELEGYYDAIQSWNEEAGDAPDHRLLGHPAAIQGEMQLQCQLTSNGLYCGDPSGYEDPRAASLRAGSREWRLLFQLDSDDHAGMMWGDCGRLYFWLTEDALRRRAFDECWTVLQCG